MTVHVGTSGWSYDHWDGVLYPPGTPPRDRPAHYVRRFGIVELNASFYRWPPRRRVRELGSRPAAEPHPGSSPARALAVSAVRTASSTWAEKPGSFSSR